jgi:putative hydrolase of the HAD superfamily
MLPPKTEMIEYYNSLKQNGYDIYLCSNITRDTYDYIKEQFDIIQNAKGGVFSCFENISKPNVEIYYNLIKKYNLNIEESIFIDDTMKNVISANEIGLRAILFNDIYQLKEEILKS